MSRVLKATKVILDNRNFRLSPEIAPPVKKIEKFDFPSGSLTDKNISRDENDERISSNPLDDDYIERLRDEAELIIDDAAKNAQLKIAEAQNSADGIINDAYENSKEILESARTQGYMEGFETGLVEAHNSLKKEMDEVLGFKSEMTQKYVEIIEGAERDIVDMVIEAVEKILHRKMDDDHDYIETVIASAIKRCTYTQKLIVRVSLYDYGAALHAKDKIIAMFERIDDLEIIQDMALEKGGCVVDTVSGSIDASIGTQLDAVRDMFEDLLKTE